MRPLPPASVTVLIATVADRCDRDWKHRIAFPFAKVAFRLPELQPLNKKQQICTTFIVTVTAVSRRYQADTNKEFYLALSSSASEAAMSSPKTIG